MKVISVIALVLLSNLASAQNNDWYVPRPSLIMVGYQVVRPYVKADGTIVGGYIRGTPDGNPYNNIR